MRWGPSAAEAASLRFLIPMPGLLPRALLAGACFAIGAAMVCLGHATVVPGLVVIACGHLPLWVRTQTTAPGGSTPAHEDVWAPADEGWVARLQELETKGKAWDASLLDVTSGRGCLALLFAAVAAFAGLLLVGATLGADAFARLASAAGVLLLPIWLNGIRTTWNPSELRLKGEALDGARTAAGELAAELDPVPLLALREGRRGKYPVDARLMLRPAEDDGRGFIGIQVQVALNNVRGTDYPYLYCVVLGKSGFFPADAPSKRREGNLVLELGEGEDVDYLVVRQHADNRGGWHTKPPVVRRILERALAEARP